MKVLLLFALLIAIGNGDLICQTILMPNSGLQSHETLEIKKIELTPSKTVIYMSIENKIDGGYFCADKNIYLTYPDGTQNKLVSSSGIPVCPESYKFKMKGEKLQFTLDFSPLKAGTEWIDIIEGCTDNCFSFYGVTLNPELNTRLNEAFAIAEKGERTRAASLYKNILENLSDQNAGIKGALYSDIITLLKESGDIPGAKEWYNKMILSTVPHLDLYIKNLNFRGIKY